MQTTAWTGRVDSEEIGPALRWHQQMQPWRADAGPGAVLIGFAVDEGVRRNAGRPGASQGPQALRAALANVPLLGEPRLYDAGDVHCEGEALEAAQSQLAQRVADAIGSGQLPLVMGGGHEVAWGSYQGVVQARPQLQRLLVVNLDAHFDLRHASRGNSGTPFLQIQQHCAARGRPFTYRVLGISRYANTQALFDRARDLGVRYWCDEELQTDSLQDAARHALAQDLAECDAVYLTVCLDVLPASLAPGVSGPGLLGLPLAFVESVIDQVMASGRVLCADVAELNPSFDRDGITARVAARLLARMARAHALVGAAQASSSA